MSELHYKVTAGQKDFYLEIWAQPRMVEIALTKNPGDLAEITLKMEARGLVATLYPLGGNVQEVLLWDREAWEKQGLQEMVDINQGLFGKEYGNPVTEE